MLDPKVSVCIPTYNRAQDLRRAVSSVLDQDLADFELIVSDDGSVDATREAVRSFVDPRILYRRNERNLGLWGNTNQCVSQARGEYVIVLQDDDAMLPGLLSREAEVLDRDASVVIVHAAVRQVDRDGQMLGEPPQSWPAVSEGLDFITHYWSGPRCGVAMSSVMFRRPVALRLGGFDARLLFSADADLWQRMAFEGRIAFLNEPLILGRVHSGQVTTKILMDGGQMLRERLEHGAAARRLLQQHGASLDRLISRKLSQDIASDLTALRGFDAPIRQVLAYGAKALRLHPPVLRSFVFFRNLAVSVFPPSVVRGLRRFRSRWWRTRCGASDARAPERTKAETAL